MKWFAVILLWLSIQSSAFSEERRFAFLVATEEYPNLGVIGKLNTPINDVTAIKSILDELEYEVTYLKNPNATELEDSWFEFLDSLPDNKGIAVRKRSNIKVFVYLSGHGAVVNKSNYYLANNSVSPNPRQTERFTRRAVKINSIIDSLKQLEPTSAFVVIDACRNEPFIPGTVRSTTGRLGAIGEDLPENANSMIALYSADFGRYAYDRALTEDNPTHSIFARHFIKAARDTSKDVIEIASIVQNEVRKQTADKELFPHGQQRPGLYSEASLNPFCLGKCAPTNNEIPNTDNLEDPRQLSQLTQKQIEDAQTILNSLGYDSGPADGKLGLRTIGALRKFQRSRDAAVTGELDPATMLELAKAWAERVNSSEENTLPSQEQATVDPNSYSSVAKSTASPREHFTHEELLNPIFEKERMSFVMTLSESELWNASEEVNAVISLANKESDLRLQDLVKSGLDLEKLEKAVKKLTPYELVNRYKAEQNSRELIDDAKNRLKEKSDLLRDFNTTNDNIRSAFSDDNLIETSQLCRMKQQISNSLQSIDSSYKDTSSGIVRICTNAKRSSDLIEELNQAETYIDRTDIVAELRSSNSLKWRSVRNFGKLQAVEKQDAARIRLIRKLAAPNLNQTLSDVSAIKPMAAVKLCVLLALPIPSWMKLSISAETEENCDKVSENIGDQYNLRFSGIGDDMVADLTVFKLVQLVNMINDYLERPYQKVGLQVIAHAKEIYSTKHLDQLKQMLFSIENVRAMLPEKNFGLFVTTFPIRLYQNKSEFETGEFSDVLKSNQSLVARWDASIEAVEIQADLTRFLTSMEEFTNGISP